MVSPILFTLIHIKWIFLSRSSSSICTYRITKWPSALSTIQRQKYNIQEGKQSKFHTAAVSLRERERDERERSMHYTPGISEYHKCKVWDVNTIYQLVVVLVLVVVVVVVVVFNFSSFYSLCFYVVFIDDRWRNTSRDRV